MKKLLSIITFLFVLTTQSYSQNCNPDEYNDGMMIKEYESEYNYKAEEAYLFGKKIQKKQTLFHLGSIPLWIILLISICMVILTILAICVFLKRFQPDVWNSLKRRCPELNRQNNYQVSSLNSCKSKFGLIKRCIPSCPEVLKFKWFQRGKTDPSRDTCFLCLKKVIENNFD